MNLYFDVFWCDIMCMKQTMYLVYKMFNFAFIILMYYHNRLSYCDESHDNQYSYKIIIPYYCNLH